MAHGQVLAGGRHAGTTRQQRWVLVLASLIPARLPRSSAFSVGNAVIFAINASLTGAIFLMPQFQQVVANQDPLGAGLRLLPWGIVPFLIGPRAGALADRIGERTLVVAGRCSRPPGRRGSPSSRVPAISP